MMIFQTSKGVFSAGGLICMTRADHRIEPNNYRKELEKEMQLMEEEGLWSLVQVKQVDKYMKDPQKGSENDPQKESFITGSLYLYQKSSN